jgi:AraC-like DNA-binding protein
VVAFGADALDPGRSDASFLDLPADPLLLAFMRPHAADLAHFRLPPADRPRWRSWLRQLAAELDAGALDYAEAARTLLILLLTDTARLAEPQLPAYPPTTRPLLTWVFRYIEAHYAEPISLRDVAAAVGHSPAYLTDLVRRATGRTVLSWIVERRMAEARYLLLETDQAVGQVAAALGYRRASHFIAHFRRLHGATPQVWRREQHAPRRKIAV